MGWSCGQRKVRLLTTVATETSPAEDQPHDLSSALPASSRSHLQRLTPAGTLRQHNSSRTLCIIVPGHIQFRSRDEACHLHQPSKMSASFPSPTDQGKSIVQAGWKITTRKLPILKAGPIQEMTDKLGIAPPEMIFGDNAVRLEHVASGWNIEFNAFDALDRVDKTGNSMLKVAYSKEWQRDRWAHPVNFVGIRET